ncbi:HAAS signaling domain-containing protein [Kribbella sp. NPDC049174]|uniref:HAAS signaling domain-containing protein n=1 Tax=Kribbella sp. NPDC049174 TaxID=3364112 RepID=UPI003724C055
MSSTTLTERYVQEVVRRIPADQRDDVADELRATIADTIDARDDRDTETAERDVLTEMGDPIRLAARYADRPLALIGPDLYPAYIRLLKLLLVTVLPIVTAVVVVIDVFDNNDIGSAIGTGIGTILNVGAQMIAWLTVVFAAMERFGPSGDAVRKTQQWTPADLPEARQPDNGSAGAIASAVLHTLMILLIIWQQVVQPYRADNGERLPILDPALWSGWIWPMLVGLAGIVVFELLRVAARGWTTPLATGYAVAEILFAAPLAWILYDQRFFNPEFVADFNGNWTTPDAVYTVAALAVVAVSISEILKRFRQSHGK